MKSNSENPITEGITQFTSAQMSRRRALGTMGKAAIGAAVVVVAGAGGLYYLYSGQPAAKTTTTTQPPSSTTTSSSTSTALPIKTGVTLNIAPFCCPGNLDPHNYIGIATLNVINFMAENLVNFDKNLNYVPSLSTSWKRISDTSFQFTLRQGVKFHDGTPFDASAVKTNIDRIIPAYVGKTYYPWLKSAEVIDSQTVQIDSSDAVADGVMLTMASSMQTALISPAAIAKGDTYVGQNCIGTGPFMQKSFDPKSLVAMTANTNYWGGAPPSIGDLNYQLIPDQQARELSLLAGNLDFIGDVPPQQYQTLSTNTAYKTIDLPAQRLIWLEANAQRYDQLTREAFFYAIDKNAIINNVFGGLCPQTNVPMPISNPYAIANDTYGPDGKWPYNLDTAKSKLQQAGWTQQSGGWFKGSTQLSANIQTTKGNFIQDEQGGQALSAMLQALGVKSSTIILDNTTAFANWANANYDMNFGSFGWSSADFEATGAALYHSAKGLNPPRAKWTTFYSAQADTLIDQGDSETDPVKRKADYAQVQKLVMDYEDMYPIATAPVLYAWKANIQNIGVSSLTEVLDFSKVTVT